MTKDKRPEDLVDTALDAATGGHAWPSKWKGFSLDGKGTDGDTGEVAIETVEIAHQGLRTSKD